MVIQKIPQCRILEVIVVLILTLLFALRVHAQTPYLSGGSVVIKHLSVDQGLSDRLVRWISQDSRGFIWVGTFRGLNRYDGEKFTRFSNGSDSMSVSHWDVWGGLCADQDGIVWIGTSRGLNKFNPETRSFKKYFLDAHDPKSLSSDSINYVFIDRDGTLWVGTEWGLNKLNRETDTWSRYFPRPNDTTSPGENCITTILEDRNGLLWIATGGEVDILAGGGLFKLDRSSGKFTSFGPRVKVHTIYEDRSGELWAAVAGPGFCRVDRSTGEFISIPLPPKDPGSPTFQGINSICEDKSGFLWMATSGWSLLRYDKQNNTFTRFSYDPHNPEKISSSALTTIFADKEGLIWVGTNRAGVNTVSPKPFNHIHSFGSSLQLAGRVDVVFQDREGYLWIAHQKGLWRFNPLNGRSTCVLPRGLVRTVLQDNNGIIWIADRFSVVRYDPKTQRQKTVWSAPLVRGVRNRLIKIMFDSEKNLWVGCNTALYRVDKQFKTCATYVHNPRDSHSITLGLVYSLAEDRSGNIWVGTQQGVSRFDKKTKLFTRMLHNDKDSTSISNTNVINFFIDRSGRLWVGTVDGLNRYEEESGSFQRYYYSDRRSSTSIGNLQEDSQGNFWYADPSAIYKFDIVTHTFMRFDRADGIEDVEILSYSCTRLKGGELLYGTNDGILLFHPDSVSKSKFLPPIVITGIKKLNKEVYTKGTPELLREISFTHEENVFSISFSALSYDMAEYIQYAYKLEGFDKNWINCGNRREAMYTNLDPGTYTFRVKGSNHDRVWNEAGTSLIVIINPAYWQTWWFRSLLLLAGIGIVAAFVQLRMRRLLAQERLRLQIASDLHDDLGSSLSSIALVSENVSCALGENHPTHGDLRSLTRTAREAADRLKDDVWVIKPGSDTLENLLLKMKDVTQSSVGHLKHSFRSEMDGTSRQVPLAFRRNILFIYKEILQNILKHSCASTVEILVGLEDGSLTLDVRDNGRGFDPASVRRGNGLINLQRRADALNGDLLIDSAKNKGTHIRLKVRIP